MLKKHNKIKIYYFNDNLKKSVTPPKKKLLSLFANFSFKKSADELPYRCRKDISLTDRLISYPVPSRNLILLFYLA